MLQSGVRSLALVSVAALVIAGCSSTRTSQRAPTYSAPEQLTPIQNSTVASSALPPLGSSGTVQPGPAPMTTGAVQPGTGPMAGGPGQPGGAVNPNLTGQPQGATGTLGAPTQTAAADSSFVTLDSVGAVPSTPGRDLTGGLTVPKLLGVWTVVSGPTECRLNLTQTAKDGTARYRASTPGCALAQLASVSSWQLAGSQVQLFDDGGNMVAALILSGNRFIGTLAGGQGISMVG